MYSRTVMVTFAPEAVKLPDADPLVPTATFPTPSVAGDAPSCPADEVPAPERETLTVGFDAFEVMVTLPLTLPDEVGENSTLKLAL